MKNSYDYQLWVLDPVIGVSALDILLTNLKESNGEQRPTPQTIDFQKRVLYAISSAARGNLDVQDRILSDKSGGSFNAGLLSLLHAPGTSVEVERKIWSFIEDMLQEMQYIRQELKEEVARLSGGSGSSDEGEANVTAAVEVSMDGDVQGSAPTPLQMAVETLRSMELLGDSYVSEDAWLQAAATELRERVVELLTIAGGRHSAVVVDDEGVEQVVSVLGGGMDKNHALAVQKVTYSIVSVIRDIMKLRIAEKGLESQGNTTTSEAVHSEEFKAACDVVKRHELLTTLQDISILNGDEMFDELIPVTQELMGLVSMCSVSGRSSRNM